MTDGDLLELELGQKLRRIREDRGLALSQLAQKSGLPTEQLEAFEESRAVPGIGELSKIASTLDVSLGHFFQRTVPEQRVEVVRSADRWTVQPQSEAARTLNYRYQALSYSLTDKLMALRDRGDRRAADPPQVVHGRRAVVTATAYPIGGRRNKADRRNEGDLGRKTTPGSIRSEGRLLERIEAGISCLASISGTPAAPATQGW